MKSSSSISKILKSSLIAKLRILSTKQYAPVGTAILLEEINNDCMQLTELVCSGKLDTVINLLKQLASTAAFVKTAANYGFPATMATGIYQNDLLDGLRQRIIDYRESGLDFFKNRDLQNARKYFQYALDLFNQYPSLLNTQNYIDLACACRRRLAKIYFILGDQEYAACDYRSACLYFDSAVYHIEQIPAERTSNRDHTEMTAILTASANALQQMGIISVVQEEYAEAIDFFEDSMLIYNTLITDYAKFLSPSFKKTSLAFKKTKP